MRIEIQQIAKAAAVDNNFIFGASFSIVNYY